MRYLIGVGLTILGGVLTAVTGIMPFCILLFVGVFLFASFPSEALFFDYVIVNTQVALARKRYYMIFLPFYIISLILTLGKSVLKILWKQEYFKVTINEQGESVMTPLTRQEYVALRNEQREIYSTQTLSKEFMTSTYSVEDIGLKPKKNRLIAASVFTALSLLMLTQPGGVFLSLIYVAVFLPMVLLWIPSYRDAKILQQAYDRATQTTSEL